jgi:hypothetical protein
MTHMGFRSTIVRLLVLILAGAVVWLGGPAHAYVLSGPHVLELMISKYGKARSLLVLQKQTVYAPGQGAGIEQKETLR